MGKRKHVQVGYEGAEGAGSPKRSALNADASPVPLADLAICPEPGDNVAIARKPIAAHTTVLLPPSAPGSGPTTLTTTHDVLEGHRFAVQAIGEGEFLLSWGLPFGKASRKIEPGEYVANARMLQAMSYRHAAHRPADPHVAVNFTDVILPHSVERGGFRAAPQVPLVDRHDEVRFEGFRRAGGRGVGTRNFVVVVPTTVHSGAVAKQVAEGLNSRVEADFPAVDGVVATDHTEGGNAQHNNTDLLVRTLSGFVVHPNVGGAVVVDYGVESVTGTMLRDFMAANNYPTEHVPLRFLTLKGDHDADLQLLQRTVEEVLPLANKAARTLEPLCELKIAQQCGGSDAFSGVSGNPATGEASKLLIQHGGAALLAETDELIGAEPYVLEKVKDYDTLQAFLGTIQRFKTRMQWHGQTAESNPSGGNALRGLYNIALKSIGAAKKKHRDVRLDGVLEYSQPLPKERGYYFMDSPGNDLESIAGQVASGCNVILFITGNGSITNFPFVPTVKIVTTTGRYNLLSSDMDFDAGQFQDGKPMEVVGRELFDLLLRVCGGMRSKGELAKHSQVSIWRDWALSGPAPLSSEMHALKQANPIVLPKHHDPPRHVWDGLAFSPLHSPERPVVAVDSVALVLPTSSCSGQVAVMVVDKLNNALKSTHRQWQTAISRFVALPHTEGCGSGYSHGGEDLYIRLMLGHLFHRVVRSAVLLEHGCEKSHNSWWFAKIKEHLGRDVSPEALGCASIQLDGGINSATEKLMDWFEDALPQCAKAGREQAGLGQLNFGLHANSAVGDACAALAAAVMEELAQQGASLVVSSTCPLLHKAQFLAALPEGTSTTPSLAFAQAPGNLRGLYVMDAPPNAASVELCSGMVAASCDMVIVFSDDSSVAVPVIGHALAPVLSIHVGSNTTKHTDLSLPMAGNSEAAASTVRQWASQVLGLVASTASRATTPRSAARVGFQVARGVTGVST